MEIISVALAHPDIQQRIELKKQLFTDQTMEIAMEIEEPDEIIGQLKNNNVDLLLLSLEFADPEELLELVYEITGDFPQLEILILSQGMESNQLARRLLRAGAFDYIEQPFSEEELVAAVREIVEISRRRQKKLSEIVSGPGYGAKRQQIGKIISVFSTKGGVGRSLLAVNLACALRKLTESRVILVDLDLQFGDDAILMDMKPTTMIDTLARDCKQEEYINFDLVDDYIYTHESTGVDLLAAPSRPEQAEYVEADDVVKILEVLERHYDYVVIDTSTHISEPVMVAMEKADIILLLLTLELPTIKNGRLMLELMDNLGLSKQNVRIVMNRDVPDSELQVEEVEEALGKEIIGCLPSQGNVVMPSIDMGNPVVDSHPESQFSKQLFDLGRTIIADYFEQPEFLIEESSKTDQSPSNLPPIENRILAGLVDYSLVFICMLLFLIPGVLGLIFLEPPVNLLVGMLGIFSSILPPVLYFTFFHSGGQTPGEKLMGLSLAVSDQSEISLGVAFTRSVALFFSVIPFGLGFFWAFFDEQQRTWHDILAKTRVENFHSN